MGLAGLRSAAAGCRACELWEPATQTVFGEGPETARIVFVGEQPGDQEDRKGEPFVGPAGRAARPGAGRRRHRPPRRLRHQRGQALPVHAEGQAADPPDARARAPARLPAVAGGGVRGAQAGDRRLPRRDRGQGADLAVLPDHQGPRAAAALDPAGRAAVGGDGPEADDDEPDEDAPAQTWMLATTHPSAVLRTPDEGRAAAYDALVADLAVVAHALA